MLLSRFLLGIRVKVRLMQKLVPSRPSAGRIGYSSRALDFFENNYHQEFR